MIDGHQYLDKVGVTHLGIINEDDYCLKSDAYKLEHPEKVLEEYNFYTEFAKKKLLRRIL